MNSQQNMCKLDNEVKSEDLELPRRKSSNFQVLDPNPDEGPSIKCSIMECGKNYEPVISHQVIPDLSKETSVAYLQKELEILRTSNKKLQEKLTKEDKEKRKLKLKLELQEKAAEAEIAERTAALVEEVYFAQRERDEAVMCRLQLALEERDEAVERMKHMEMSLKLLENINPEENDMCRRLQQELDRLKEQSQTSANNMRHPTAEHSQERALKAKLLSMEQARETALEQYKRLEEEIQTLRVYYSLHKSLSQEENLKDQFNHALSTYEEALRNRESVVSITQQQNEELVTQLEQAMTERANMELQLQRAVEASQAANEKVQKLERLVDVLRKKVGSGTVRTVI
ncbi:mirror-image polydactyly gene 1 protein isoform X5 [Meriones unguiculatus]|uniref:mirror-image polydactyly gene 1 protein isoform X5 n=1 Tax=Meriones unguiculatus TaxID=10047 RepID=UPI00293F06B6|nr:mirror-image polydactyly gene 1 protein isoform X5 [Meriones unguiculatus]